MSRSLVVPIVKLENVREHPNADSLDLCNVLGYQMCIPKGKHKDGDVCVYFPADTLLPDEWSEKFGIKNLLKGSDKNRVGKIRLRGEPSFGLVVGIPEGLDAKLGDNVADYFGCEKYEPPIKSTAGDAAKYDENIDPFFERYTDIENGCIFTDVFKDGEEVVVCEKIHGTNCKIGFVCVDGVPVPIAGSMSVRRKRPSDERGDLNFNHPEMVRNTYWFPWSIDGVFSLLKGLNQKYQTVLLYGEVFGGSVQELDYGVKKGKGLGFMAFDLMIDGKYLDWDEFNFLCEEYNVPVVPVVYRGPYTLSKMKELADGKTTIQGVDHIREGVVVRPSKERLDEKIGRAILKFIGTEYELSKHSKNDTKDV